MDINIFIICRFLGDTAVYLSDGQTIFISDAELMHAFNLQIESFITENLKQKNFTCNAVLAENKSMFENIIDTVFTDLK